MKTVFMLALLLYGIITVPAHAQNRPEIPGLTPEHLEQIRKMLPPGLQLPPELGRAAGTPDNGDDSGQTVSANAPPPPEPGYAPLPDSTGTASPFGSDRSLPQREAAAFAVNAELDRLPYTLPQLATAPSKTDLLILAHKRHAFALKNFSAEGLTAYARTVTWVPTFDGKRIDVGKAREYSLLVSAATNYFSEPYYIMALAAAIFALDPQSSVNANNFASAIAGAGERLHAGPFGIKELGAYRRDAETVFHYALARSIRNDTWGEESFTPIINLGYLYIDMGRLNEARSLFQVARKLKPYHWDAAKAMATYFLAIGQPGKALAILEDPRLDKPMMLMVAKKSAKILEKSEPYSGLSADTPEKTFAEGIQVMSSEPIATAADFVAQLDQSERNRMRYFVEHLPPVGSFSAPQIHKLTQYASAEAIKTPPGQSALKDFDELLQTFGVSAAATAGKEQLKKLSRLGMDIDLGIDLDDLARHPEKYTGKGRMKIKPKFDRGKILARAEELRQQAKQAEQGLATGKTGALTELVSATDTFHAIVGMDPEEYADPLNIIIQKHNYAVHNRKTNLYNGYLFAVNKRIFRAVTDIQARYDEKMREFKTIQANALRQLDESDDTSQIKRHRIHTMFINSANAAAAEAYGSATTVAAAAYVQQIKPKAEAFYYDVIRHVGLISDPEVRDAKDADLRRNINAALHQALAAVRTAHGAFRHYDEWECGCSNEALEAERESARQEMEREEEARRQRNKAGKRQFDSKDIPPSTPLWKKLDAFGTDLNIPGVFFLSGRISCARTVVKLNTGNLPIPDLPQLFAGMTRNEFTGATTYDGGMNIQVINRQIGENGKVTASIGLSGSVSTDGQGVIQDYSVTPSGELTVKSGETTFTAKGEATFGSKGNSAGGEVSLGSDGTSVKVGGKVGPDGNYSASTEVSAGEGTATIKGDMSVDKEGKVTTSVEGGLKGGDASASGKVTMDSDGNTNVSGNVTVKTGGTTVTVNGQLGYGPNGELNDSDFSAGVTQDMKNGFGSAGKASFEASTKRGCTVSGELKGSIMPSDANGKELDKSPWENIPSESREKNANGKYETVKVDHPGATFQERPVTDLFHRKTLWSGKFNSQKVTGGDATE
jgi:hypothetical protein